MQIESLFIGPDNSLHKFIFLVKDPFSEVKMLLLAIAFYVL